MWRAVALVASVLTLVSCSSAAVGPKATSATFFSVDQGRPSAMTIFDWNGRLVGHRHTAVPLQCCAVTQSPDGTRIEASAGSDTVVLDRHGRLIGTVPARVAGGIWSDDDVHRCQVRPDNPARPFSGDGHLLLVGPGDRERSVATVSGFGPHGGPGVLTCDMADNFALIATSSMAMTVSISKVRLSDGKVLSRHQSEGNGPGCSSPQVISSDGRYSAFGGTQGGGVCDLATGRQVAELDGGPEAISWKGHVVIEAITTVANSTTAYMKAVDWRNGSVLWQTQPAAGVYPTVQPIDDYRGDAIAFTFIYPQALTGFSQSKAQLWLVRPGRQALLLRDHVEAGVL